MIFTTDGTACPILVIPVNAFSDWLAEQTPYLQQLCAQFQFRAESGAIQVVPDAEGRIATVICCVQDNVNLWGIGNLPKYVPEGVYQFEQTNWQRFFSNAQLLQAAIIWGLGAYQFTRYKQPKRQAAQLLLAKGKLHDEARNTVDALNLVRDLINTPTDDCGPSELAAAAKNIADTYGASYHAIVGEDLLTENYASIYTVGRASDDAPRLIDLHWGDEKHPKVTLVGKGVCFDTGGLDIKPANYMQLMKKDMGGGAHVLGLAQMVMAAKLPIRLRVLIPMVENSISGNAYRPGDVIKSRKGLTIEVGNTDCEGRVILADALTEAVADAPELLIDISTLTGAARVAVGTDIAAFFANRDDVAATLHQLGIDLFDPMWRLPLYTPYRDAICSQIADLNNAPADGYAGAITAALFLKEFVPDTIPWLHFDIMAWNLRARPGHPVGGEAMAIRALFAYLQQTFA